MIENKSHINKNTLIKIFLSLLPCLLVLAFFFGVKRLPRHYTAEMIEGWVLDAETKEPLTDAIIVAFWELKKPWGLEGDAIAGYVHLTEVLTDDTGHYLIPGWGPERRQGTTYLGRNDPKIIILKPGYNFLQLKNDYGYSLENWDRRYEPIHHSDWSGKVVELKKLTGDLEKFAGHLDTLQFSGVRSFYEYGSCKWTMVPNLMHAFGEYKKIFDEAGIASTLPTYEILFKRDKSRCNL